jgi:putative ABC transport system permease protein
MTRLLFRLALLAYPRAFRRRFGAEMLRDFDTADSRASFTTIGTLGTFAASGLAERWSAAVRALFWPNHRPHLYEPAGRHFMFWDTLRSDLQHTLRLGAKTPLVTSLTIIALALGIGATTAIFAVVNGVLIKPLPYADSNRLVVVWSNASQQGRPQNTISPANYRDFAAMNQTLEGLEGYYSFVTPLEMVVDGGQSEVTIGVTVTPELFDLLGRAPLWGRNLTSDPSAFEVVLSHGFWQRRFGGDPSVVGRTVQIGTFPATIAGVMPSDFTFPYGTMLGPSGFTRVTTIDLWAPMRFEGALAAANRMLTPQGQLVRGVHWLGAIGRMKPDVTVERVQADLSTVARQLEQAYPETNKGWGATVVPVLDQTVGSLRGPLLVLLAGVAFVLLMATVNVANLVLARSIARQKELATRVALGAGRRRLVQQALTEGLMLAVVGGAAGLLLARWGIQALVALAPPDLPRLDEVTADGAVLGVAAITTLATGMLVGLLPALTASRVSPQAALQDNARGAVGSRFRHRTRAALVVAEVALAVTLTIGAGLLLRSFSSLMAVDPGFRPENLLTWQTNLPDRLRTPEQRDLFYTELLARLRALPGVVSVGGTSRLPLGSTGLTTSIDIDGRPLPNADWPEVQFRRSVGDYFQTMDIPIVRGRTFTPDDHRTAPPVAVINQVMASRLFPGEDAVGKRIRMGETQPWVTIIGVIGDVKHGALDEELQPELYMNHMQGSIVSPYVALRTTTDAASMMELVRAEALAIDRDLPVYRMQTMESVRAESLAQRRFVLVLVALFGILALTLAAIGVYGVMSLLVSERTQEVGVRLALGAHPSDVLKMLVAQATRLAVVGVTAGVGLSLLLMPLLRAQLYGVEPRDPMTLAGVPAALVAVALLAALIPARRAMRVDPVKALRYE